MTFKYLFILYSITLIQLNAQNLISSDSLNKIVFIDYQNNNYANSYYTEYEIQNNKLFQIKRGSINLDKKIMRKHKLSPSNKKVFIKDVPNSFIDTLFYEINRKDFDTLQPKSFGFDQNYLSKNAESIAKSYFKYANCSHIEKNYFIKMIKETDAEKFILPWSFYDLSMSDYPTCAIQLIFPSDTFHIYSNNQNAYMIPWKMNDKYESYNQNISMIFSSIIPYSDYSNKERLYGENILQKKISNQIYTSYCEPKFKLDELSKLLKEEMDTINKYFHVYSPFTGCMSSIDWDCFEQGEIWGANLKLKSDNISFNVTMKNNNINPGSIIPLIDQIDDLLSRLNNNKKLMDIKNSQKTSSLEIHFVENKSLSDKAQSTLLKKLPNHLKNTYLKYLDQAIFLDLKNENGYSRWLLFPNNDLMLWQYTGFPPLEDKTEKNKPKNGLFMNSFAVFTD